MGGVTPVLVVHGGAGSLESDVDRAAYREGVAAALEVGLGRLGDGAAAAVAAAVVHMESHTIMNAGRGAALARDGSASLDAGFMDGATRRYGAVTGVRRATNPVLLAEHLTGDGDYGRFVAPPEVDELVDLVSCGACDPGELVTERALAIWEERAAVASQARADGAPYLDTVGAVALDADGHVAAAVSTGGMSLKRPGRVGDSPVVGGGFWADDRHGACVTTGVGEALMRQGTARRCVQLLADGRSAADAAAAALAELVDHEGDRRGSSGLILVTRDGEAVLDHNSDEMSAAWGRPDGTLHVDHLWRR